jgi:phytoene dehydrogenase-like protein
VGVVVNGSLLRARHVISNVDAAYTYERLLPAGAVPARKVRALTGAEPSLSGFILLLGVRGEQPHLAHHNLFFCADYAREFDDLFSRGTPPGDPTVYVAITRKRDPDHAPPGCENWFVLVNAPPLGAQYDWTARAAEYRDHVLATLARRVADIRDNIVIEKIITPLEIERMTGARRGAARCTAHRATTGWPPFVARTTNRPTFPASTSPAAACIRAAACRW